MQEIRQVDLELARSPTESGSSVALAGVAEAEEHGSGLMRSLRTASV